jgi:hypothetical protein
MHYFTRSVTPGSRTLTTPEPTWLREFWCTL